MSETTVSTTSEPPRRMAAAIAIGAAARPPLSSSRITASRRIVRIEGVSDRCVTGSIRALCGPRRCSFRAALGMNVRLRLGGARTWRPGVTKRPDRRHERHTSPLTPSWLGVGRQAVNACRQPRLRSPCRTVAADGAGLVQSAVPAPTGRPLSGRYGSSRGR